MAHDVQIAVDCVRPHELADWWAEALGWAVEPQDEAFIRRMVAEGHASAEHTVEHRGALTWRSATALRSPDPGRPRMLFQAVPEPKTVKNRLHLDVHVGADPPYSWVTLADPRATSSASPEAAQPARRSRASLRERTVRSAICRTRSLCRRRSGLR